MKKRIVRLTESDLTRIVKRVLKEQTGPQHNMDIVNAEFQAEADDLEAIRNELVNKINNTSALDKAEFGNIIDRLKLKLTKIKNNQYLKQQRKEIARLEQILATVEQTYQQHQAGKVIDKKRLVQNILSVIPPIGVFYQKDSIGW